MNEKLKEQLRAKYLRLCEKDPGFDCGDGWYNILDVLVDRVSAQYDNIHSPITYIKQKWGKLQIECESRDVHIVPLIYFAQDMAARTCESCGAPGRFVKLKNEWITVACKKCELKENKEIMARSPAGG